MKDTPYYSTNEDTMAEKKDTEKKKEEVKPRYFEAQAVAEIAQVLIKEHHQHLNDIPIFYLFNDGKMQEWASMSKKSKKDEFITGYQFVMEVSYKQWIVLTDKERIALVDHELCHASLDDKGNPVILDHDIEEFAAIVSRHGLWRESVRKFGYVCADQLNIDFNKANAA
ncbi:MAG: putative metallopeptidase [bacterium]